jgi:hypothetical protein
MREKEEGQLAVGEKSSPYYCNPAAPMAPTPFLLIQMYKNKASRHMVP